MSDDNGRPQVSLPDTARDFIESHGGTLYIWPTRHGCCGGVLTLLDTNFTAPSRQRDWIASDIPGIHLFLESSVVAAQEITVLFRRWPRPHLTALWNGCAWVG